MSKDRMNWDRLRVFGVVAELESMTAAAKQLGESTPTISRKIDDLERVLNCRLLVRSTKGVEVTELGRQILRRIHVINDQANFIWEDVSDLDEEAGGELRIGSLDGVLSHWLTQFLPEFLEDNKQLQLQIRILENTPKLLQNEADLSFVFTKPQHR
ncbi:LysR family transcriptional regulator, partial [Henriciella sp.]|uniref:LysR family transcriptional regulator n=1 Tax=Henriciella sp. TaxID=1968823 RepID=UPI003C75D0CB